MDETFVPMLALVALVKKFIDFAKYLTNRDVNGAITQIVVWGSGVVAVCLFAQTDWAEGIIFAGRTLADMNFASQLAVGLGLGSTAGVVTDVIKASDDSDSAAMPKLLPKAQDGPTP